MLLMKLLKMVTRRSPLAAEQRTLQHQYTAIMREPFYWGDLIDSIDSAGSAAAATYVFMIKRRKLTFLHNGSFELQQH